MNTQAISVGGCNPQTIVIGRRGTYNTQEITFDLSYLIDTYGAGVAALMVMRSQDETAYPAVVSQEDTTLTWTVSEIDTYYVGSGEVQLMWYVDGGLAKTVIFPMVVMKDILQTTEEPPDAYQTWVDDLLTLGAETLQNAQDAAQSASEAEQSATDADAAKTTAENAQTAAETAQGLAEDAKTAAETAQGKAETAQVKAETAQEKAETAQEAAEAAADRAEDALEEFTTPTASATTLDPDDDATASYANGHFTFGIPKGDAGDVGATPDFSIGTVQTLQPSQPATASITGTRENPVLNLGIPKGEQGDPATNLVQSVNGKTGAVVLDSGDIAYESTTVEEELGTINSALSSLQSVTEIIDTASGAIASFPDGSGLPMRSLVAQINPVQDLHGQDAPYPAGGMGNKWNEDWEVGTINVSSGNESATNNSIRSKSYSPCTPDTDYYVFCGAGSSQWFLGICWYDENKQFISGGYRNRMTVTSPSNAAYFKITTNASGDVYGNTYNQDIAVNNPATVTTYHPYSNICPISGWQGLSGEVTGFNIWDEDTRNGYYNPTGVFYPNASYVASKLFKIKPNTGYSFVSLSKFIGRICYYDLNQQFISSVVYASNVETFPFTTPSNAYYMAFDMTSGYGGTYKNDISINYPSTDTAYHSGTANEAISVSWQDEAGTVYGGTATYNGDGMWTLVATWANVPLSTNWYWHKGSTQPSGLSVFTASSFPTHMQEGSEICSHFKQSGTIYIVQMAQSTFMLGAGNTAYFCYGDSADVTLEEFKAFVTAQANNGTPVTVTYKLTEPLAYTITTGELIDTLYGQNNVWVDTGDVSVTYQASIKGYIDKVLAS